MGAGGGDAHCLREVSSVHKGDIPVLMEKEPCKENIGCCSQLAMIAYGRVSELILKVKWVEIRGE